MSILTQYTAAEVTLRLCEQRMSGLVKEVYDEYRRQKAEVSTVPWTQTWRLKGWKIKGKNLIVDRSHYGLYGYSRHEKTYLPAKWLEIAQEQPEDLAAAVAVRIQEEGEKIARQEAKKAEKTKAAKLQAVDGFEKAIAEIKAKYPEEFEATLERTRGASAGYGAKLKQTGDEGSVGD